MPKKPIKPAAPVRMTKRQISRHQREQRQVRLVIAGVAAILALIILIPAFGLWREVLAKGDQPLAVVAGESISISTYAKVLGFRQYVIQQQVAQLRSEAAALITPTPTAVPGAQPTPTPAPSTPAPGSPTPLPTPSDPRLADLDRQFQQLTRDNAVLEDTVQKDLINDVFIRQELAQRGVTVSSSEVDQAILSDRSLGNTKAVIAAQPTTEGGSSTEPNPTSVVQLPGPTLDSVRELVASSGYLSWDEFRRFVAEPRARKAKLQSILAEAVPSQAEQVHARHIVLKTEEDANKALARLQAGEDFAALAKELSTDEKTKDNGGDLGWLPRGIMDPAFDEAAFQMTAGELPTRAVRTQSGYELIKVEEFQPQRAIEPGYLNQLRQTALDRWLEEKNSPDSGLVSLQYTDDKRKWVDDFLAKGRG